MEGVIFELLARAHDYCGLSVMFWVVNHHNFCLHCEIFWDWSHRKKWSFSEHLFLSMRPVSASVYLRIYWDWSHKKDSFLCEWSHSRKWSLLHVRRVVRNESNLCSLMQNNLHVSDRHRLVEWTSTNRCVSDTHRWRCLRRLVPHLSSPKCSACAVERCTCSRIAEHPVPEAKGSSCFWTLTTPARDQP